MTRDKKILFSISIALFLMLFFALFIPHSLTRLIVSIILIISTYFIHLLIKKRSILSINKKQILLIMLVISFLYVLTLAFSGIFFGYYLSLDIFYYKTIYNHIIPTILIIISIEIIRRILLAQNNKFVNIISFIIGVLSDIIIFTNITNIKTFGIFMELIGMVILPSITSNILYTHVSRKYGYWPNIIYRIIITLYPYILPFDIGTPDALIALFKLVVPLIVYYFIYTLYTNKHKQKVMKKTWYSYASVFALLLVIISIAMLISCQFKYGLLVIGSESMVGELNKGDAIIYKQYQEQEIHVGDIIVFKKDNMQVIHRVMDIKYIDGVKRYYTKGDANEKLDVGYITDNEITGISQVKISYIGYPTIWIREIFM